MQACACREGAGDWAVGPTLPQAKRGDLVGSRSRGFCVASQRGVPGGRGHLHGLLRSGRTPQRTSEPPRGRGTSSSWFSQNRLGSMWEVPLLGLPQSWENWEEPSPRTKPCGSQTLHLEPSVVSCVMPMDRGSGGQAGGRCPVPRAHHVAVWSQNVNRPPVCSGGTAGQGRTPPGVSSTCPPFTFLDAPAERC